MNYAAALTSAARTLRESARAHKRSAAHHRRQARSLMAAYDELRVELEARGIRLDIEEAKGEESHGPRDPGRIHPRS